MKLNREIVLFEIVSWLIWKLCVFWSNGFENWSWRNYSSILNENNNKKEFLQKKVQENKKNRILSWRFHSLENKTIQFNMIQRTNLEYTQLLKQSFHFFFSLLLGVDFVVFKLFTVDLLWGSAEGEEETRISFFTPFKFDGLEGSCGFTANTSSFFDKSTTYFSLGSQQPKAWWQSCPPFCGFVESSSQSFPNWKTIGDECW